MGIRNQSTVTEFLLSGLTDQPEFQLPLFFLFLGIYVATTVGNISMILIIWLRSQLHIPMYYFLSTLSFIDFCLSSVIVPKTLVGILSRDRAISYSGCMTQFFLFCFFGISECYILVAMAYDRYVAICSPLLYNVIMSPRVCSLLVAAVFSISFILTITYEVFLLKLNFCESNIIKHYFCDIVPLMKLSCSSTYTAEHLVLIITGFNTVVTSLTIIISYAFILASILSIQSKEGRSKAFSTCGSHLTAVLVFYGSIMAMYLKPASSGSAIYGKVTTVFYTIVIPMLNPMIYSLRNKEVQNALMTILRKKNLHNKYTLTSLMYQNDIYVCVYILTT